MPRSTRKTKKRPGRYAKPRKDWPPSAMGTRAPDAHVRFRSFRQRWVPSGAPDPYCRTRREALKHCGPGERPVLVSVVVAF